MTQHRTEAVKADLIWALHDEAMRLTMYCQALASLLANSGYDYLAHAAMAAASVEGSK